MTAYTLSDAMGFLRTREGDLADKIAIRAEAIIKARRQVCAIVSAALVAAELDPDDVRSEVEAIDCAMQDIEAAVYRDAEHHGASEIVVCAARRVAASMTREGV